MSTENEDTQVLEAVQVPAFQGGGPADPGDGGHDDGQGHGRHWRRLLIALCVAVVLIAAGIFGARAFNGHITSVRQQEALEACRSNLTAYDKALKEFEAAKTKASADAGSVGQNQVDDSATVSDLQDALKADVPTRSDCSANADRDTLNSNAAALEMNAGVLQDNTKAVSDAVTAVSASKKQKTVDDAKNGLNSVLTKARSLLSSTEGKVADNATRSSLQEAITAAEKTVAANDTSSTSSYENAQTALQKAIDAVNASVQKKEQEDSKHVTADQYQFDIPDYWQNRVVVQQSGDTATIYSKDYPDRALCQLRVVDTANITAGDIGSAMVAHAQLDSTHSVAVWTTRWGYVAAKDSLSGENAQKISDEEAQTLVDLQTGGKVKYQQIYDAEAKGDGQSFSLLNVGDEFVQSTIFNSLKRN